MKKINYSNLDKLKRLNEYLGKDVSTAGFDPAAKEGELGYMKHVPWNNEDLEKRIRALQSKGVQDLKSVHAGPLSKNYYQWDVVVKMPVGDEGRPAGGTDRLWVYDENELWSTNMASLYKYIFSPVPKILWDLSGEPVNDTIIIYKKKHTISNITDPSDEDLQNIVGYVDGVYLYMNKFFLEAEVDRRPPWLKWLQTVMDFAGFIPLIGDVVDIGNAAVYFAYGKNVDGFLSLIGAVPAIGSVVSTGAKGMKKLMAPLAKEVATALRLKTFKGPIELLVANKVIEYKDLNYIVNFLQDALPNYKKTLKQSNKANLSDPKKLGVLDEFAEIISNTIRDLKLAQETGSAWKASSTVVDAIKSTKAAEKASIWTKFIPKFKGIRSRLAKTGYWPDSQIARIAKNLDINFIKHMGKSVDDLTALIRMTSPSSFRKHYDLINAATKKYITNLPTPVSVYKMKPITPLTTAGKGSDTKAIRQALNRLQRNMPSSEYDKLVKSLVKVGQEGGSLAWNTYKTSNVNNMRAYVTFQNLGMTNTSLNKWVDVLSNEVQNIAGDIAGQPAEEQEAAVIWPTLQAMLSWAMPGAPDTVNTIISNPIIQRGAAAAIGTVKYAADAAGLTDSDDYEVFDYKLYK